jgi:hypothetical protein
MIVPQTAQAWQATSSKQEEQTRKPKTPHQWIPTQQTATTE